MNHGKNYSTIIFIHYSYLFLTSSFYRSVFNYQFITQSILMIYFLNLYTMNKFIFIFMVHLTKLWCQPDQSSTQVKNKSNPQIKKKLIKGAGCYNKIILSIWIIYSKFIWQHFVKIMFEFKHFVYSNKLF